MGSCSLGVAQPPESLLPKGEEVESVPVGGMGASLLQENVFPEWSLAGSGQLRQ